jgi:hypothetical protein
MSLPFAKVGFPLCLGLLFQFCDSYLLLAQTTLAGISYDRSGKQFPTK